MIKILLIDNSLDTTGASLALVKLAEELRSDELDFVFVFPRRSKCVQATEKAGFTTYEIPFVEISKKVSALILYFPCLFINAVRLGAIAKKENIDLVHVNDIYNMTGLCMKLFRKTKLVTHIRRMPESFPRVLYTAWSRLHVKFADRIVAVSIANSNGLPPNKKTVVVYDPLPEKQLYPLYAIKPDLSKDCRILYFANYTEGKGHPYALTIINRAIKDFPDCYFSLHFYGGTFGLLKNEHYRKSLEEMAGELKISDHVFFNPKSDNAEKEMKMHDVVLNLSDSESFSRVSFEALYYGVPVIATNVGGTAEMMPAGMHNLLVPAKDADAMYQTFRDFFQNDALRIRNAQNGYNYVRDQFGEQHTSRKIRELYLDLIKK